MEQPRIYVDHAATTPLCNEAWEAMEPYLKDYYGNASSLHEEGQQAKKGLENARRKIASLLGVQAGEIFFTSGGTESDNWALRLAVKCSRSAAPHVITSSIEHPAILSTCRELEKEGVKVTFLSVDPSGYVDPENVRDSITEDTCLVSIMTANNEIGTIQRMKEIGEICMEKQVLFHTDAVQAFGKIPVDVHEWNVSLMSASGHKFYGPKGVGFLYIRKGTAVSSFLLGGRQERGYRAGTENVAGIVGMAAAAENACCKIEESSEYVRELQDLLMRRIMEEIPEAVFQSPEVGEGIPGLVNVRIPGIEGESLAVFLDMAGIAVSTASACESGSVETSHVLLALGLSSKEGRNVIRISLGKGNTKEEIERITVALKDAANKLRFL